MLVASVDFPTPPLGLATTTTGMRAPLVSADSAPLGYVTHPRLAHSFDNMQGIYLIAAHPAWRESRVNRRLRDGAQALAGELPLDIQDLYGSYPDYHIDVAAEQARVDRARLLVLLHPVQWYSMPALLKLWFDEVLTYGWAYGAASAEAGSHEQAPAGTPGTALRGKD